MRLSSKFRSEDDNVSSQDSGQFDTVQYVETTEKEAVVKVFILPRKTGYNFIVPVEELNV